MSSSDNDGDTTTPLAPCSWRTCLDLVDGAEHPDAAALADVLRADEAEYLVAEVRTPLERVQQSHRMRVGADDHDRAAQSALLAQPSEDPSRDRALCDEGERGCDGQAR